MKIFYGELVKDQLEPQQFIIIAPDSEEAENALHRIGIDVIGELNEVFVYDSKDRVTLH